MPEHSAENDVPVAIRAQNPDLETAWRTIAWWEQTCAYWQAEAYKGYALRDRSEQESLARAAEARLAAVEAERDALVKHYAEAATRNLYALKTAEARLAAVEALLDQTDADAQKHQHLARLSTHQIRAAHGESPEEEEEHQHACYAPPSHPMGLGCVCACGAVHHVLGWQKITTLESE